MQDASESELPVVAPNALAKDLYVVGIGASAGGLEAIRELAKNLPQEIRASYVVVQHMSPQHKSLLTTLIDRETHLTVVELSDATAPEANVIYVTPPN
ncbi:MAG: chemotaxis protein CheB, partial [Pseudomonadota bacterium]